MDELRDLFQEVILDHYRKPKNFGGLDDANRFAHGQNPLCGDDIKVYLKVDESDTIREVRFEGAGCAICTASASLMTEAIVGKPAAETEKIFEQFHAMTTGSSQEGDTPTDRLGKLKVFGGVAKYPVRVKCATLPWHTLQAAISQKQTTISTE